MVVWREGSSYKLYRNGVNIKTSTSTTTLTDNILYIGRYVDATNYYSGLMGDIRIYNRALSADEIALIYNKEKSLYGL